MMTVSAPDIASAVTPNTRTFFSCLLRAWICLLFIGFAALALYSATAARPELKLQKQVLVIYSSRTDAPYTALVERALRKSLEDGLSGSLDYYTEHVDFGRFSSPEYSSVMRDFLQRKYSGKVLDLIITEGDAPFDFVLQNRKDIFPETPWVFSVEQRDLPNTPNSTGLTFPVDMSSTLDLALRLHPRTKHVFVVSGASKFDAFYKNIAEQQFKPYEDRVAFTYLSPFTLSYLQDDLSGLPEDSIIYFVSFFEDGAGNKYIPIDVLDQVSPTAARPIYCWPEMTMGHGVVGGYLLSEEEVSRQTGELALRILRGESADQISDSEIKPYVTTFDWRQLKRWNIDEGSLPTGSVVRFRELTFWEMYRIHILAVGFLIFLQAVLIAALLVQRSRREKAEESRKRSEQSLRELTVQLMNLQEDERRRIAAELHDGLCQTLSIIKFRADMCRTVDSTQMDQHLQQVSSIAQSAINEVREMARNLRPRELDELGLVRAIQAMITKVSASSGVQISTELDQVDALLSPTAEASMYRIVQESLNNVTAHSQATTGTVAIKRVGNLLHLSVKDNGVGFIVNGNSGFGLKGIRERITALGGKFEIDSKPGFGTILRLKVPLSDQIESLSDKK